MRTFTLICQWLFLLQCIATAVPSLSVVAAEPGMSQCAVLLEGARELPLYKVAMHLAATRDIHALIHSLEQEYGSTNFVVRIPFSNRRFFFLQDPQFIRLVLNAKTSLGFVNRNFDISHRHPRTINAVNTTDELWKDLHQELTDIFSTTSISPLMEKYKSILLERAEYDLNETLEEYFLKVWSEYTYGDIDVSEYQRIRLLWVETLGKAFHSNRLNRLPVLGELTSRIQYRRYRAEFDTVDRAASTFLASSIEQKKGAFYELYTRLQNKYGDNEAFLIARDNSLLGILVYDFVYGVVLDYVATNAKTQNPSWRTQLTKSQEVAFLYPWRFRVAEEPIGGAETGDLFVINLVKGKTPFSYGPRVCSGAKLFGEIIRKVTEIYSTSGIQLVNPEESITYNGSKDIPIMTSKHRVKVKSSEEPSPPRCPFHHLLESKI